MAEHFPVGAWDNRVINFSAFYTDSTTTTKMTLEY